MIEEYLADELPEIIHSGEPFNFDNKHACCADIHSRMLDSYGYQVALSIFLEECMADCLLPQDVTLQAAAEAFTHTPHYQDVYDDCLHNHREESCLKLRSYEKFWPALAHGAPYYNDECDLKVLLCQSLMCHTYLAS